MWIPKTEKEIIDTVTSGILHETAIFDAKLKLPQKSIEIAKDVAAMANDGGVIIFGIGEDINKQLTILNPIDLANESEKIDAIVRSCISEPPQIAISSIQTEKDKSLGYIVVTVPPSPRAPHMVVVNGENRYYGRSATGNILLNEGEVARLYLRREKIETDLDKLIFNEINLSPYPPDENLAYLFFVSEPVYNKERFFGGDVEIVSSVKEEVISAIKKSNEKLLDDSNYFFQQVHTWKHLPQGILGEIGVESNKTERRAKSVLNIQVDFDGRIHFFYGRAGDKINCEKKIFCETIVGLVKQFICVVSTLYQNANYSGLVSIGLAITGLKNSTLYTKNIFLMENLIPYSQDVYSKAGRFLQQSLVETPEIVAKKLVALFVDSISQGNLNLFKEKTS